MPGLVDPDVFFREVTLRICSSLEIGRALQKTSEYLKPIFHHDYIGMYYLDPSTAGIYSPAMVHGDGDEIDFDTRNPVARVREAYLKEITQKFQDDDIDIEIIDGAAMDYYSQVCFRVDPALPVTGFRSAIIARLRIDGDLIGVLDIDSLTPNAFGKAHVELLRSVRQPVAIAMSNARLYEDVVRMKNRLADDNRYFQRDLERLSGSEVIGAEFGLKPVMDMVYQVASLASPVLLTGETGTGKEVIANAIHMLSPRRTRPMIRVQCGAIPDTLLDSELFGHEKGAFTGASVMKRGRFERAAGGTVFLDEIGELSLDAQVKLLGVLQDGTFERLGGGDTLKADVRVIAATHRDLRKMVDAGKFREDLWFRLNVFPIVIPPLRYRKSDIPDLVHHFISRKSREMNLPALPGLAPDAMDQLMAYHWPGNVRELQNVIERALIICRDRPLEFPDLLAGPAGFPGESPAMPAGEPNSLTLDAVISRHIRGVLARTNGRIKGPGGAAELLDMHPSTLRSRLKKLGIPYGRRAGR